MTYLKLKNNRLRISLTKYETEQIFGSADGINKDDPKTALALKMLFKRAVSDNNLEVDCSSVWIEVVKNLSGGYDIYFTNGKYSSSSKSALVILEFSDCEKAIQTAKVLFSLKCDTVDSRFYKYFNKYRIIILMKDRSYDMPAILEFADNIFTSRIDAAKTVEHGKLIIKEKALSVLSGL